MADVFISHSSKDKEIADRLCEYLERNGLKCWIAPRNIEPGCEWPVAISEAIQNVKIMVVIYSHNAASSTQVPKELTLADKRKKRIIPYKIDDAYFFLFNEVLIYGKSTTPLLLCALFGFVY